MNIYTLQKKATEDFRTITTSVIVTPEHAKHIVTECRYPGQRPISKANVDLLKNEMQVGRFLPGTQIFVCFLPDGSSYLVNGYHRMLAVIESGIEQEFSQTAIHVLSMEDVHGIYGTFDQGRNRTIKDVLAPIGGFQDLPYKTAFAAAASEIKTEFFQRASAKKHVLDRREAILEYMNEAHIFLDITKKCQRDIGPIIRRSPVLAVALVTIRHCPDLAREFWGSIARDEVEVGTPEKALLRWLRNHSCTGTIGQRENVMATAAAWNAKFEGRYCEFIRPVSVLSIFGTPFASIGGK